MPTYRNDSPDSTYSIKNSIGKTVDVPPGASVQTFEYLGTPFVETSTVPEYNPILSTQTVTLTAQGIVVLFDPHLMGYFIITNISDTVTAVFNESTGNTPPLFENWPSTASSSPRYNNDNKRCRKIVLTGTGTCKVTAYKAD